MKWQDARPASTGTHHVLGDAPLYDEHFDEVLAFHEPGLAPVRRGVEAWHIRIDGSAAYERRFQRTFGFYEGLATVVTPDGWRHIHPDGTDHSCVRFDWCGNFQGGLCPVRASGGTYFHINSSGEPAYRSRWRYAGDFRNGIGVVQADDCRSTHIDGQGRRVHGVWFLDLDVYHKGFARARDEEGWMHIDVSGQPLYRRRFAAIEPFYNGQARVERFDGGREVIDETGQPLVELRPPLRSAFAAVSGDLVGFWRTQAICAAVELGVFDALPGSTDGIARACRLDPVRTKRLLRALGELRLTAMESAEWRTTERGDYLKSKHPCTLAGAAVEYGRFFPRHWEAIPAAIRAGSNWHAPDIFDEVAIDPCRIAAHHRMLESYALHDYECVPAALELVGDEQVIDAGGGLGGLASLLVRGYPRLHVVILDRPEVIEQAARKQLGTQVELRSTDIFRPWGVKGSVVVLARVLHDWDDALALQLLHNARCALPSGGQLFVIEMLLPEDGMAGGLCDLHLLMATGGKERTAADYISLLERAGFDFDGVRRISALPSIIVGVAR